MENHNKIKHNYVIAFFIIIISILLIIINIILALIFPSKITVIDNNAYDKAKLLKTELVKKDNNYISSNQNILIQNNNLLYKFNKGLLSVEFNHNKIDVKRLGINKFEITNSDNNRRIISKMNKYYNKMLPSIEPNQNAYGIRINFKNNTISKNNNHIIFISSNQNLLKYLIHKLENAKYLNLNTNYFNGKINTKSINSIQNNFNENNNDNIFIIKNKEQINQMIK